MDIVDAIEEIFQRLERIERRLNIPHSLVVHEHIPSAYGPVVVSGIELQAYKERVSRLKRVHFRYGGSSECEFF